MIEVSDLHVRFPVLHGPRWPWSPRKEVHAVNGVGFTLGAGKTLGVVGESGCGKSTLIRAIAGLVRPSQGAVRFDGRVVDYGNRGDLQALRRQMQMIFQDPIAALNPRMTIREIVTEPLRYFRPEMGAEDRRTAVRAILDRVGIAERSLNRYPHEFSGGQAQRIGIARALVAEPRVLLCDEPVSALDVSIQAQVINLLKELQREMGLTLIFVAHDLGVVRHISDDILVMYTGGIMEMAPADQLVAAPRHPYTAALLSAVPIPDPRVKTEAQILVGDLPSPMDLPPGCLFQSRCPKRFGPCASQRPEVITSPQGALSCHLTE